MDARGGDRTKTSQDAEHGNVEALVEEARAGAETNLGIARSEYRVNHAPAGKQEAVLVSWESLERAALRELRLADALEAARGRERQQKEALGLILETVRASAEMHDHSAFPLLERAAREALGTTDEGTEG